MVKTFTIEGSNIHDIPSFYKEINRLFMDKEDWKLADSLDALEDMFYGAFGRIKGNEEINLIWNNFEKNKRDLGFDTTIAWYKNKLKLPSVFNRQFITDKINDLTNGTGQTYFDIILEIIGQHKNINLFRK